MLLEMGKLRKSGIAFCARFLHRLVIIAPSLHCHEIPCWLIRRVLEGPGWIAEPPARRHGLQASCRPGSVLPVPVQRLVSCSQAVWSVVHAKDELLMALRTGTGTHRRVPPKRTINWSRFFDVTACLSGTNWLCRIAELYSSEGKLGYLIVTG